MSAGRFFVLILIRFACPAVAAGRHTRYLFEGLGKVAGGGKAAGTADDGKRVIRGCQQLFRLFYTGTHEVADRRDPIFVGKGMHQIIFVYMRKFCQLLQGEIIPAVLVDVASH